MSSALNSELNSFHRFISEQLSVGRGDVSTMANGDSGMPLNDFDREFRRRHGNGFK
ncbi:MAG TPA: hypothetical protein VF278_08495 [Pirellulales bacterium]